MVCDAPLSDLNVLKEKSTSFLMQLKCNLCSFELALIFSTRPDLVITKASRIPKLAFSKWTEELQLEKFFPPKLTYITFIPRDYTKQPNLVLCFIMYLKRCKSFHSPSPLGQRNRLMSADRCCECAIKHIHANAFGAGPMQAVVLALPH